MSETISHRRSVRRPLDLEQLKGDPTSLLAFGADDPVLRKLETRRLHEAGYAAEDIAQAFGFSRPEGRDIDQRRPDRAGDHGPRA